MSDAIVIGGGVGGLAAAIVMAERGVSVTVCEASPFFGGLASALEAGGTTFDGGPYILLDPVGLGWAFEALGLDLEALQLRRVHDVYEVERDGGPSLRIGSDVEQTARGLDEFHRGQGDAYRRFIERTTRIHAELAPLQTAPRPSPWSLIRSGAIRHAPFLMRSLGSVLASAGFRPEVADALGIFTHVAGQPLGAAPSPIALVPAMISGPGCFVPRLGVATIPERVLARAAGLGVTLRSSARVARILCDDRRVTGVELATGERLDSRVVVSDASGAATLLELAPAPDRVRRRVAALPLQSPGVAAYLLADARPAGPYLRFRVDAADRDAPCRLLVRPGALDDPPTALHARQVRVVAPLAQATAERLDAAQQDALVDQILREPWTRERVGGFEEAARLTPARWGRRHTLHRNSMNPVMTAQLMRRGRLPHVIDTPRGLFLVGSSTHPGQWVSFCLVSGVLGAREVLRTLDGAAP
jgi:phytoene dehydrogenase-like protein